MAGHLGLIVILVLAATGVPGLTVKGDAALSSELSGELNFVERSVEETVQAFEHLLPADSGDSDGEFGVEIGEDSSGMEVLEFDLEEEKGEDGTPSERELGYVSHCMSAKDYVANYALQRLTRKQTAGSAGVRVQRGKGKVPGKRPAKRGKRKPEARLRGAIMAANRNPAVPVLITLTNDIRLSSPLPLLVGSLTVEGACQTPAGKARACVIDGQKLYPIFKASINTVPCTVTLQNLVLQNAKGGAYTGDPATESPASCNLVAQGVQFLNNVNTLGGAVYMLGTYNIRGCLFEGNSAEGDGGAILAGDAFGFYLAPALGSYISADGVIFKSVFKNNRAGVHPSRFSIGNGGAIAHFGGPTVKIRSSVFDSNQALSNGTNGGAIHFRAGDNITVSRTYFANNKASVGGAVYAAPLLQFNAWGPPFGPNVWGTARFCRCGFSGNMASQKLSDVAVAGAYAFDTEKVKAIFCPKVPAGYGSLDPDKVVQPPRPCAACYKV